jgi:hypothetical protein
LAITPADKGSNKSPLKARVNPSAIWLRQELPVQRKRIFIFFPLTLIFHVLPYDFRDQFVTPKYGGIFANDHFNPKITDLTCCGVSLPGRR